MLTRPEVYEAEVEAKAEAKYCEAEARVD